MASSKGAKPKSEPNLDDALLPKVALIGRPNVGKSALFNRLVRKKLALVYDTPESHVTRDYREARAQLGDLHFKVVDTSGLEPSKPMSTIQGRATEITAHMLAKAHMTLFVVDARDGISAADEELAIWVRRHYHDQDRLLLVANKAEGQRARRNMDTTVDDCYRLGLGEPVAVSASTGEGMTDLYAALQPHIDEISQRLKEQAGVDVKQLGGGSSSSGSSSGSSSANTGAVSDLELRKRRVAAAGEIDGSSGSSSGAESSELEGVELEEGAEGAGGGRSSSGGDDAKGPVKVAIMGLPNAGKSTLMNALLQEQRALTGPEPGLTRDSIRESMQLPGGVQLELVDTAGWIGQTKGARYDDVGGAVADMARGAALSAMTSVHVVLLLLDCEKALKSQRVLSHLELTLAAQALDHNRALMVVANKVDALNPQERKLYMDTLREKLDERFLEAGKLPILEISAATGDGLEALLPRVMKLHTAWDARISTGRLNRFARRLAERMAPAGVGREVKRLKYITQVRTRPPTFLAFMSGSRPVSDTFERFVSNQMREEMGLHGVPMHIWCRYKEARSKSDSRPKRRGGDAFEEGGDGGDEEGDCFDEDFDGDDDDASDRGEGDASGRAGGDGDAAQRKGSGMQAAGRHAAASDAAAAATGAADGNGAGRHLRHGGMTLLEEMRSDRGHRDAARRQARHTAVQQLNSWQQQEQQQQEAGARDAAGSSGSSRGAQERTGYTASSSSSGSSASGRVGLRRAGGKGAAPAAPAAAQPGSTRSASIAQYMRLVSRKPSAALFPTKPRASAKSKGSSGGSSGGSSSQR